MIWHHYTRNRPRKIGGLNIGISRQAFGRVKSLRMGSEKDTEKAQWVLKQTIAQEQIHKAQSVLAKPTSANHPWDEWVIAHMETRWGGNSTDTSYCYMHYWWSLEEYFKEKKIPHPAALTVQHVENYIPWRVAQGIHRNTAIHEVSLLGWVSDYACRQQHWIAVNPAKGLRFTRAPYGETKPWSDHQVETVQNYLMQDEFKFGWMYTTFLMGYFQGVRMFQCQTPLDSIDLENRVINYPRKNHEGWKDS